MKVTLKATVLDADAFRRSMTRIAHEIVERNHGTRDVVLVGIMNKGVPLARRLARCLQELQDRQESGENAVAVGELNPGGHRDDLHLRPPVARQASRMPEIDGRVVVLVDDVIWHGRTVRAAMDALIEFGRPRAIQLAVLIDRGHRELPIRPDYVGKNVPTAAGEHVQVLLTELDGVDGAQILQ